MRKDYHQVLGVGQDASQDEIKRAYWKLAKQWHPDRCFSGSSKKRHAYEDKFIEISEAYRALRSSQSQNIPPIMTDLSPDQAGPQPAGSTVIWTARASDPDGDPVYYKFWLQGPSTDGIWTEMTGWIIDSKWAWKTGPRDAGHNMIKAEVRDGLHAGPEGWDDWEMAEYRIARKSPLAMPFGMDIKKIAAALIVLVLLGLAMSFHGGDKAPGSDAPIQIVAVPASSEQEASQPQPQPHIQPNQAPSAISLDPDKKSPQKVGTSVKWAAAASDPEGDRMYYQFLLQGPATGNKWQIIRDWSTSSAWTWDTSLSDAGSSQLIVRIRDGLHEGPEGFDAVSAAQRYAIINLPGGSSHSAL
ncbi:MAG TPA: J domain-containing protein [Methanotrichaceae archaeon]|nr:J domain-containing protein [Methanotrichaceae archaeon]